VCNHVSTIPGHLVNIGPVNSQLIGMKGSVNNAQHTQWTSAGTPRLQAAVWML